MCLVDDDHCLASLEPVRGHMVTEHAPQVRFRGRPFRCQAEFLGQFEKQLAALRYWFSGRGYYLALDAMEYASRFHTGTRKDGLTPEFQHQLSIAHHLRSLEKNLMFAEETLAAVFLHDVPEDFDIGFEEIESRFGPRIKNAVMLLTKKHRGTEKAKEGYFKAMAEDPIASLVKGGDRVHNIQSMVGVFSQEKQKKYMEEAEGYIIPMLKDARRKFPRQEAAYENIKFFMASQIDLIRAIHAASAGNEEVKILAV